MIRTSALLLFLISFSVHLVAQDTLPRFTLTGKTDNKTVISWTNPYRSISQIGIQRSPDSTRNFKTILTVPDPLVKQNGFADTKAPVPDMFYRLFVVLDSGKYFFTNAKRPIRDTLGTMASETFLIDDNQRVKLSDSLSNREVRQIKEDPRPEKLYVVKRREFYIHIAEIDFKKFRDSILYTTKDTMVYMSVDTIVVKPFVQKEIYRASKYVFTEKYGNVMIVLPDATTKKYSVSFFEENKKPLFEIKEVQSASLTVDKSNFVHSGWFWFELFEEGKLKERYK
ncbi:MAG TPA: hypothetical protein VM101_13295, partial [Flavitalea sp.]|nr:hypothetical protein [Flavitalea sp.]